MDGYIGVFEGGGVRGIALAGAAAAALERGVRFHRVVGTSAGALVGSLVAAGYDADDLEEAVDRIRWPSLFDRTGVARLPGIGPHLAMLLHGGVARGEVLEETWQGLLAGHGVVTFGDLPPGSLRVVATDLTHARAVVLPEAVTDLGLDPRGLTVARAVRASSAVPFMMAPVRLQGDTERWTLVDGALAARYPVQLVEPGTPSLGFRLVTPTEPHPHRRIRGPISLAVAVIGAGMSARETLPMLCRDVGLVVEISVDHDSLDFDLDTPAARALFESGRRQARTQLAELLPLVE